MSNIKLILTDLDGTVAEVHKHEVSEKVREAVVACENQGVQVVPVTGRFHGFAKSLLEVLGFDGLGVFDNGASIRHCETGELVWSCWLDVAQVKQVAEIFAPHSRIIDFTPDHDVHEPADNEIERIAALSEPTSHVYGLVPRDQLEQITKRLLAVPNISFYVAPDIYGDVNYAGIQVNREGANKFHGVEALRGLLHISKENTLAIGDGDNDTPLFDQAGLKIAMGNATEALKAQADHIVGTVADDGFAEAMNRFVLNKKL